MDSSSKQSVGSSQPAELNRRQALLIAGSLVGGLAILDPVHASASPLDGDAVGGFIERLEPPGSIVLRTADRLVLVSLLPDAELWRGYPVKLSRFVPEDEVLAEGIWVDDDSFRARSLISVLQGLSGRVVSVGERFLNTTGGAVRVTEHTTYRTAESVMSFDAVEVKAGDAVDVLGRFDPMSKELVGVMIFSAEVD